VEVGDTEEGEEDEEEGGDSRDDGEGREDSQSVHERATKVVGERGVDTLEVLAKSVEETAEGLRIEESEGGAEDRVEEDAVQSL
jgi:hypothetical protein